jgi:hypothetical protein
MNNERLIWHPNEISPEEWNELSREQQIQWWRDRQPKHVPVKNPLRHINYFKEGKQTLVGVIAGIFDHLTDENIMEFIDNCPAEVMHALISKAETMPPDGDDNGWEQVLVFSGACYAPWVTAEEIKESERRQRQDFRDGIRVFRAHRRSG